jgi:(p)ppGpp synthase/HD superfamily hydrolase
MHQIAEFGFAAHWDYKQHKKQQQQTSHHRPPLTACVPALPPADTDPPTSELDSERAVFYTITAAEQEALTSASNDANEVPSPSISSPYLQALEVARQSLVESSVFVFLAGTTMEHGQLMVVKKGERIMDIWANLLQESDLISTRTLQAWRNGRWADLDEQVQNGDVLLFQFQQEHETSSVGAKKKNLLLQKASARLASAVE